MKKKKPNILLRAIMILSVLLTLACFFAALIYIPSEATWTYGAPSPSLSLPQ